MVPTPSVPMAGEGLSRPPAGFMPRGPRCNLNTRLSTTEVTMSKPRTTKSSTPNPVSCFHQPPRPRELLHFHLMHKATVRQIAREAGGSNG